MIHFPNNGHLVTSVSELPHLRSSEIVLDFETTSGDTKTNSLNPWHNCSVAGVCICTGPSDNSPSFYIPINHKYETPATPNLPKQPVARWLLDILADCTCLVGHNIKYDAHVLFNDLGIEVLSLNLTLYDTLTQAKILNSDRRSYSLDVLSKDWLGNDISEYEAALAPYLFDGRGNKVNQDYGAIPASVMAPYGCQDVLTTRDLKAYITKRLPESCQLVSQNEIKLTRILLDMERTGMCVNPTKVTRKKAETLWRLTQIIMRIREITGSEIRPNTADDCFRFLCGENGLPILKWTNEDDENKTSNPSFDKSTLTDYLHHPRVVSDPALKECVELIKEYRILDTFNSLFLNTFEKRSINNLLHPNYNQCVSTGRLSCSDPNAQQMSSLAKELIEVDPDWVLVDIDLSQIDYRVVASTVNNPKVVAQYNDDPSTDYHQLVADMAGISRRHGKTLNLAIGFGMGERSAVNLVKSTLDISSEGFLESGLEFDDYCTRRSKQMYSDYHKMMPELKATHKSAALIARKYGYIANLYGRRRHFPKPRRMKIKGKERWVDFYHRAFPSYVQSSAADIAKHITILIDQYAGVHRDTLKLFGVVHDSWIFYMHKTQYIEHCLEIKRIIENLPLPNTFRVPILCSVGVSTTNWAECEELEL